MSAERRLSLKSPGLTSSQPSGSRAHSHAAKARGASLPPETRKRVVLDCILLPSRKRRNTLTSQDSRSAGEQPGPSNLSRLESLLRNQNKPIGLCETIEEAYSQPFSSQRSRKKRKRVASSPAPLTENAEPRASQQIEDDMNDGKHSADTSEPAIGRVIGPMTPLSFVQLCYKRLREAESEPPKQVGDSPAHSDSPTALRPLKHPRTQMQQETSSPPTLQQASECLPGLPDGSFRSFAELSRATTEETVVAASVRDPSPPPLPSTVPELALPPAAPLQDDKRPSLLSPPPRVPPRHFDDTSGQEISYDVSRADFAFLDLPDVVTMPWEATPISYVDEGGKFQEQDVFLPPGISCLVEAMKHTLACERAALLNAEVRHDQELRRRLNAEHQVELLMAENMRLREALQKNEESISHRP